MSQTLSLNSSKSIMITTFWGGEKGRCYTIHLFAGNLEFQTTLNEEEFFEMVLHYNDVEVSKFVAKPSAENDPVVKIDPNLQKLLDEEEEIAWRRWTAQTERWAGLADMQKPIQKFEGRMADPDLEKLLDEEEEIAQRNAAQLKVPPPESWRKGWGHGKV